jgi:hypothetical protein
MYIMVVLSYKITLASWVYGNCVYSLGLSSEQLDAIRKRRSSEDKIQELHRVLLVWVQVNLGLCAG